MPANLLALKPFLETIRTYCAGLSTSGLTELLCRIAQEVPAGERLVFLEELAIASSAEDRAPETQGDGILARAEELTGDIFARQESIEDGSYYEEHYEEDDYYDDEFPDSISEEQKQAIEVLFAETDSLFLAGEMELAKQVYQKLIELVLNGAGLHYTVNDDEVNISWRETLARYCRCVYETSSAQERPEQMLFAMEAERPVFKDSYDPSAEILPSLRDVFDAKAGELAGWNDFLKKFKKKLGEISGNRAFLLYLEAVHWLDGIKQLAAEVRKQKIPVGYLYWLDQLRTTAAWSELAQAAQETLNNLPFNRLRSYAAAQLSLAGKEMGESSLAVQGKREQFFSEPQEQHLAALLQEAMQQKASESELGKVLEFISSRQVADDAAALSLLKIKTMLLLGNLREAYAAIDKEAASGWSDGKETAGAVYASILLVLSKGNADAKTIHGLFDRYVRGRYGEYFIRNEIQKSLLQISIADSQKKEWFQFIAKISAARAAHIVANKYRKGYARAAEALGGYMECLVLHDQKSKAAEFLDWNRNQQYKRYPAFRREIDEVVKNSPLLQG